jgi:hypothetical protein
LTTKPQRTLSWERRRLGDAAQGPLEALAQAAGLRSVQP